MNTRFAVIMAMNGFACGKKDIGHENTRRDTKGTARNLPGGRFCHGSHGLTRIKHLLIEDFIPQRK